MERDFLYQPIPTVNRQNAPAQGIPSALLGNPTQPIRGAPGLASFNDRFSQQLTALRTLTDEVKLMTVRCAGHFPEPEGPSTKDPEPNGHLGQLERNLTVLEQLNTELAMNINRLQGWF